MVEVYLAVKVFEEDKHFTHICSLELSVPVFPTMWYDFLKKLRAENLLGEDFFVADVEVYPTMKPLMLLDEEVQRGKYRVCLYHKGML